MLILLGILLCASIYLLALFLCFLSPPKDDPQPQSRADRFKVARENMQANAQLATIHLDMQEDFYTAILKIGFSALTIASEAVYLNEGQRVSVARLTWLEEERMKDLEVFELLNDPSRHLNIKWEEVRTSDQAGLRLRRPWRSGYDRQINPKTAKLGIHDAATRVDGVGYVHFEGASP